jgi:hypothetical protein
MSTPYYHRRINAATGQIQDDLIGLSGAGAFQFQAYPTQGLVSFKAWQERLAQENSAIVNGANKPVLLKDFLKHTQSMARRAVNRLYKHAPISTTVSPAPDMTCYRDETGHLFQCPA